MEIAISVDGKPLQLLTAKAKTFKTGSVGFYVWGKIVVDGKKHQLSGNVVEIGSKPK